MKVAVLIVVVLLIFIITDGLTKKPFKKERETCGDLSISVSDTLICDVEYEYDEKLNVFIITARGKKYIGLGDTLTEAVNDFKIKFWHDKDLLEAKEFFTDTYVKKSNIQIT